MELNSSCTLDKKRKHDIILVMIKLVCLLCVTGLFAVCWYVYYKDTVWIPFFNKGNIVIVLLYYLFYYYFAKVYEATMISMKRVGSIIYSQFLAIGFADATIYIVICLLARRFTSLIPGLICFVIQFGAAAIWALFANMLYYKLFEPQKSIVIYDTRKGLDQLIEQYELGVKYDIQSIINVNDCLADFSLLDGIEVAFLSGVHSHDRNIILKYCIEKGIRAFIIPRIGDSIMSSAQWVHFFHIPLQKVERYRPSVAFSIMKRLGDIILSLLALIVLSPIMLATAIAIKIEDGGPVFYIQNRLTRDGKVFPLIKFRSMHTDAEKDGVARLSTGENDNRITKVGKLIRKTRIDELPQLLNILKGDMSIIGPRPERPEIAEEYEKTFPEFRLRLQTKAGLTGYAQVYGKYNTSPYDKLLMDLSYIAHPSIIEEITILFATIKILFMPESTEGIAEGATTAMDYGNESDHMKKWDEDRTD